MQQRVKWRRKLKFQEFFDNEKVPDQSCHHQQALRYLSNTTRRDAVINGLKFLLSDSKFWCFLVTCLLSVVAHALAIWLSPPQPYVALVNRLECAWYHGTNDTEAANFLGLPYALAPRPIPSDEDQLDGLPTHLLRRWQQPVSVEGLDKCILAHRSSECWLDRGVHRCYLRANPEFCAHHRLLKYRRRRPVSLKAKVKPKNVQDKQDEIVKTFEQIQKNFTLDESNEDLSVSEDCLFLSISRPKDYATGVHPIVVFVTGSGFTAETTWSAGQDSQLHPDRGLASQLEAVVVRVNYRLGFYGTFFDDDMKVRNFGLADVVRALQFVHEVGDTFGGDTSRVIIVGHGSGAAHAMAVLTHQKATGRRLVHAAWLSSGPSRIPESFQKMERQLRKMLSNSTRFDCQNATTCRQRLLRVEEGELQAFFTESSHLLKEWSNVAFLREVDSRLEAKTRPSGPPPIGVEWLAPDGVLLDRSPTEGEGPSAWDDVPVVLANVDSHFEAFPGFGYSDEWRANWKAILDEFHRLGYSGSSDAFVSDLARATAGVSDPHSVLIGARAATWLMQVCPYRHLAKRVAAASRSSPVYHYVSHYALKYPAQFAQIRDNRKLRGAFYGLDLLLMLGTAPNVASQWDRKDDAFMRLTQRTLREFARDLTLPSSWQPTDSDGSYTVFADTDGSIRSDSQTDRMTFCDTIPYDAFPQLRSQI